MKIAVISGKGGSGKSSITAALIDLAQQVIAVDCDVDASNLPLLFTHQVETEEQFVSGQELLVNPEICIGCGICESNCIYRAIQTGPDGTATVNNLLCEGCGLCRHLCPQGAISVIEKADSSIYTSRFERGKLIYGHLHPGDDNSGKLIAQLRQRADSLMEREHIPLQILDGPPGIGCPVLSTVTGMDRVLLVCEPTLSGISDLHRAYRIAHSFCKDIQVIINKCNIHEANRQTLVTFCQQENIPVVAELPFNRRFVEAQIQQQSIITYTPDDLCSRLLKDACPRILAKPL